jgi:hypothetical protein
LEGVFGVENGRKFFAKSIAEKIKENFFGK